MEVKPGYKQSEDGVIPADWDVKSVKSMGEVRAGKALAVNGPGDLRPYLRTKNVFDGRIEIDDILEMPMTDAVFALYRLRHGDVLLNEGQSIELVGRCAMYQDEFDHPCAIQNQLVRFRAFLDTSAGFATHLFRRCQANGIFAKIAMQTTSVAHLGVSRFANLRLAWPRTREEQEAIAGALSDADALMESLEQLIAKKRQIKQGEMQELLTGQRRLPGFTNRQGYKMTEVGVIPIDWQTKRLGDLGTVVRGGSPRPAGDPRYFDGDFIPWLTVAELTNLPDHQPIVSQTSSYLTKEGSKRSRTLPEDTLIIANSGATLGIAKLLKINCCANDGIAAIINQRFGDKRFIIYYINSQTKHLREVVATGNGQPNLNTNLIRNINLPYPDQTEQFAISEVLRSMDEELTALEQRREKIRALKQSMMQELLTGRIRLV